MCNAKTLENKNHKYIYENILKKTQHENNTKTSEAGKLLNTYLYLNEIFDFC